MSQVRNEHPTYNKMKES